MRFTVVILLALWLCGLGIWALLHRAPACEPSYTLRGVPFTIAVRACI